MTTPPNTALPSAKADAWTLDDERALLRRQRLNERAVQLSSVIAAAAVALGAGLAVLGFYQNSNESSPPAGPVEPLAFELRTSQALSYETAEIKEVAELGLDEIRYPWRSELQGWEIAFLEPRGQASGYTWSNQQRIEVFVKPSDDPERVARVLAHELGHAVDVSLNTGDERRSWLVERDVPPDTEWWPVSGRADFESGAGDFAEVFAFWQLRNSDFRSELNPAVDEADIDLMAELSLRTPAN